MNKYYENIMNAEVNEEDNFDELCLSARELEEELMAVSDQDGADADSYAQYVKEAGRYPLLTAEEEIALARRIEAGYEDARELFINSNLRLVISYAVKWIRKYPGKVQLMDLIQEGNIALIDAVNRYDWRPGYRFSTYASKWIMPAIRRAGTNSRVIIVPNETNDCINAYQKKKKELINKLGYEPSARTVAEYAGSRFSEAEKYEMLSADWVSLDKKAGGYDSDITIGELIEDNNSPDPEKESINSAMISAIESVIARMPAGEAEILKYHFGLCGYEAHSCEQIGNILGVSREHVKKMLRHAVCRIREDMSISAELIDFYY